MDSPLAKRPLARRSTTSFRIASALPCLAAAVLLAGCAESTDNVGEAEEGRLVLGHTEEREVVNRGVAPGGRLFVLEGYHGNINLEASAGQFVVLEFVKTARGEDGEEALRLLDEINILEEGNDDDYRYVMQSTEAQRTAVSVSGSVPERTGLQIQWESGTILLSGPDGPLQITNGSGNVEAAGVAGNAEIRVNNGGILVGIEDLPAGAKIILETSNGDITVSLPANVSARVAAQTAAGAIRTTGLSFQDRQLEPMGAGAEFNGQLGRGTANIRLRTDNGTIHLQEGRMDRLPPIDTLAAPTDTSQAAPSDTTAPSDVMPPADTTTRSERATPSDTTERSDTGTPNTRSAGNASRSGIEI